MIFTEETMTEMRKRIAALTQERDNFVAEANRTISTLNGRIAELTYLLDTADKHKEEADEL